MPIFTLTVATSADGFISRSTDEPPQVWASAEEQELFFRDVNAADWSIMGRNTHEAADKPDRRRIVFSAKKSGWLRETQLWVNPAEYTPGALSGMVSGVHPLERGLILGGTRVHDWFLSHNSIHRVNLTVEPVHFGDGLPVFSGQTERNPVEVFTQRGMEVRSERELNAQGTRYLELTPK